ncbi:MAG: tetratricopeptide repeat protein [bacterium]
MESATLHLFAIVFGFFSVFAAPAFAAGNSDGSSTESATAASYVDAKAKVDAGDYDTALPMLLTLTADEPKNADAWNLLGFTHRMLGHMDESSAAYLVVLQINPDHLGALEYQGELFLQTGKPDLARANLDRLKSLCGDCEQFEDLEKAIAATGA